ncbi:MAG: hypothetical protein AAB853_03235 [Patescibacteria group bacterium]
MTWNYHILKERQKDGSWTYGIHEVYYDEDSGAPIAFTAEAELSGDSVRDIREELEHMRLALRSKPLDMRVLRKRLRPLAEDMKREEMIPWEMVKKEIARKNKRRTRKMAA